MYTIIIQRTNLLEKMCDSFSIPEIDMCTRSKFLFCSNELCSLTSCHFAYCFDSYCETVTAPFKSYVFLQESFLIRNFAMKLE